MSRIICLLLTLLLCLGCVSCAVPAMTPEGDDGLLSYAEVAPTAAEKARVAEQYRSFLAEDLKDFPLSFTVDQTDYRGFGADFTLTSQTEREVRGGTATDTVLTHTSGLVFTVTSVLYPEYNAYDWVLYINNPTDAPSPTVTNLNGADLTFEGENPVINGNGGDSDQYTPYSIPLDGRVRIHPDGGRSTQGDSSYFELLYGDKGVRYAVGWPGQWLMSVDNLGDLSATHLLAGQETFCASLLPGETVRTPLMAFVHYDGQDTDRATNLWRRWIIDCNMHRNQAGQLPAPTIFGSTSIQYHEMTQATDRNQMAAIDYYLNNDIDISFWWMDAGWYYRLVDGNLTSLKDWGWTDTGVWLVDQSRFPSKMKDISDHAAQNGIKTLLWFEPERIANQSQLTTNGTSVHPDWVLPHPNGSWPILDLGNAQAREWMTARIIRVMEEGGISMYREDFNTDPLDNWNKADGKGRKGITENLYIQGHLAMWDAILAHFPDASIDSCSSGGKRNDLETMRRAVPLHKTDYAYGDRTAQQAIATEMSRWIPYIGTKANGETADNNNTKTANRYSLRTAMTSAMVLGYDTDPNVPIDWDIVRDVTQEQASLAKLHYGDYYTLLPRTREETDWAAWQYYDGNPGEGYALAFRRSQAEGTQTLMLKGLEKESTYKVWFEDADMPFTATGEQLMQKGVTFTLPCPESSDILHFVKFESAPADRRLTATVTQVSENGQHLGAVQEKDGKVRIDIRFNMALRQVCLPVGSSPVTFNGNSHLADYIGLDGTRLTDLLTTYKGAVSIAYDAANNILQLHLNRELFDPAAEHTLTLSEDLAADSGATLDRSVTFTYKNGLWS